MRIEKINEHQIRCTLYQKDLKDREIRISELAYGTEKARALFRDMMQQASYEFGFEADDIPLMIEAIPMLPDALILLITKVEDPDELDTRFSNFTDDPSEHYLDDSSTDDFVIINDDEEFDADDFDIDGPDSAEDLNIEQMLNEVNSQTKWPGLVASCRCRSWINFSMVMCKKNRRTTKPLPTRTNPTSIWNTLWNQM